jgi:hypothetical protein
MKKAIFGCVAILFFGTAGFSQQKNGIKAIKESDLKRDLYAMADDHFRGREAGTLDELKAAVWLADQARIAHLEPAGDDGTYFQFFSLWRNRIAENSTVTIGSHTLQLWKDAALLQTAPAQVDADLVFISDPQTNKIDLKGKAVALILSFKGDNDPYLKINPRRYVLQLVRAQSAKLIEKGASAVFLVTDDSIDPTFLPRYAVNLARGLYDIEGGVNARVTTKVPVVWLPASFGKEVQETGKRVRISVNVERFQYPSVNVVAKVNGTDKALKEEHILYGGHIDHDGVRYPLAGDSIYNGADDNASVNVALLAIGRAFVAKPAKRSALFIWHGAEERGLLGSYWYAKHPTVPAKSIVAVLNGDMIGNNHPDSAALLGGTSPEHRNSPDLYNAALKANADGPKFKLDQEWDKESHREGFYYRSDHLPYVKQGYPAIFFTTLTHPIYHTPQDEAKTINYPKLKKVTDWMYLTGWAVAEAPNKPALDPAFKLLH